MTHNKFGLGRKIPSEVEREVRRKSGFGCVVCGEIFCDYHHIEPYEDAKFHDPDKIILLCKLHHGEVTGSLNGRKMSDDTLSKYILSPYGLRKGNNVWRNLTSIEAIKLGNFLFLETEIALRIDGLDVLSFSFSDEEFPIVGVNALFFNSEGREILKIKDNVVMGVTDVWDFREEGNTIQVNSASHKIDLRIIFHNNGLLEIERLRLSYLNGTVEIGADGALISKYRDKVYALTQEARIRGGQVGIEIANGVMRLGKGERTQYFKGASNIAKNSQPSRLSHEDSAVLPNISQNQSPQTPPTDNWSEFSYNGTIAGQRISIQRMRHSHGSTAIETDGRSIRIGVSNGSPMSMRIEKMSINSIKKSASDKTEG
ncbi:HNH endonuclease [Deinococcus sp.]|uniref:HNH endonuclease signature motif containing protein n=1 Tax=Deinococcus sp. TaxID=47478 RepID=UPI003CC6272F